MPVTRITLFAFASLAIASTLVAKLQNIVHVNDDVHNETFNASIWNDDLYPDGRLQHIMWFLQVSDLHLSIFYDLSRGPDLKRFCTEVVPAVKPSVVLATGDLIDAKTPDHFGSRQYPEEWRMYQQALYESGVFGKTVWLDIRGNHDNFNVMSLDENDNLYRKYSVQGEKHRRSYSYRLTKDNDVYTFIGIDACMDPGPKRPFNFLGVVKKDEFKLLEKLLNGSRGDNMTIWFGHYPTSTIVSPKPGVRELMRSSGPYLCGHLHTLGGMVPEMYTLQSTGSLELELADWKENRKFRLAAIDYGMFTFIDHHLGDWPLILVTNPKDALFTMPVIEPLHRMKKSTHIRVLIFSPHEIAYAKVQIDGGQWKELKNAKGPLFTAKWQSFEYMEGLHKMTIYAQDQKGNEKYLDHSFSLDGTRPKFPLGGRLALMGHISVGQVMFASTLLLIVLPLCVLRICLCFGKGQSISVKSEQNFGRRFIFKLYLIASYDLTFWPVVLGALYVAIGPWFVGYVIDDHIGICFVWGIFIQGIFLPGGLTYFAGILYLVTFYIPFVLCLSQCFYQHCRCVMEGYTSSPCSFFTYACRHAVMFIFILWEILLALGYLFSYGTMAFFLGFTHSWSIIMALILWRFSVTITDSKIIKLGVWEKRHAVGTPLLPNRLVNRQISEPGNEGVIPS